MFDWGYQYTFGNRYVYMMLSSYIGNYLNCVNSFQIQRFFWSAWTRKNSLYGHFSHWSFLIIRKKLTVGFFKWNYCLKLFKKCIVIWKYETNRFISRWSKIITKWSNHYLASLTKWLSVRLQTKWLWVRIPLLSREK